MIHSLFANSAYRDEVENLKHDIKTYEKELIRSENIFRQENLREYKHLFTFDSCAEAIHIGKALKKFNDIDKLNFTKIKIDNMINKINNI